MMLWHVVVGNRCHIEHKSLRAYFVTVHYFIAASLAFVRDIVVKVVSCSFYVVIKGKDG